MRIILITLVLSLLFSGFITAANAAGHLKGGEKAHISSILDCCPNDVSAKSVDIDQGNDVDRFSADVDCHHACSAQAMLSVPMVIGFDKLVAIHELIASPHIATGLPGLLFRPPQFSA